MFSTHKFRDYFPCHERRWKGAREVREVPASIGLEQYLRTKIGNNPSPMKDLSRMFREEVRIFLVDDIGAIFQGNLEIDEMPDVHVIFWDRVLRGREFMCHEMAKVIASEYPAPGVWTAIPRTSVATLAFAKRVGFVEFAGAEAAVGLKLLLT